MHNDYHTRYAKMTSFLLSIFLNKEPGINDDIVIFLEKLSKEISEDNVAELKYYIIFPVVKNLLDLLNINKNIPLFFRKFHSYHEKIKTFLKNSPVVVYLLRDIITELADAIICNIINNSKLDVISKKMGVLTIFHLAISFQLLDLHFKFIELLLIHNFEYNLTEEFNGLIDQIFNYSLANGKLLSKPNEEKYTVGEQRILLNYANESSYATDGSYIYVHQKSNGLFKIGTGQGNTFQGKIYLWNKEFFTEQLGSLVYACGRLIFRSADTNPDPFIEVDPDNLKHNRIQFSEGQSRFHFGEMEAKAVELQYPLDGHELISPTRSKLRSTLISEGRFIYLISTIGKVKNLDKKYEGIFPDNTLINIDIFDPLKNCEYVCSIPLTDSLGLFMHNPSPFAVEAIDSDIITDGIFCVFLNASAIVTFNMVTKAFTCIEKYTKPSQRNVIDTYNSRMLSFGKGDGNKLEIGAKRLEINMAQYDMKAKYNQFNIFIPAKMTECEVFTKKDECAVKEREERKLYEMFIRGKPKNLDKKPTLDVGLQSDKWRIISILLSVLSQGSIRKVWFPQLNSSNMLSHVFQPHVLHFSKKCLEKMANVYHHVFENFKHKATIESQMFIISSLFTLINGLLHQIVLLKFTRYDTFHADCALLKRCIEDAITFSSGKISGITVDLLSQSIQMVDKFAGLFGLDNLALSEMIFESPVVSFSKAPNLSTSVSQSICSMLENILSVNDSQIFDDIEIIIHAKDLSVELQITAEFEKKYETLINHFLKIIYNSFHRIENKNDTKLIEEFQKLFNNFYPIFQLMFTHMENLLQNIDIAIQWVMQSVKKLENIQNIIDKVHQLVYVNSYTFRMFYSIISVISLLSSSTYVIFKTWHHFFDFFLLFDRSVKINEKYYSNLQSKDQAEIFDIVLETSHPSNRDIEKSRKFEFTRPCNIYVEFDPFSLKENDRFDIKYTDDDGNHTESFTNGYHDVTFTKVKDLDISFNFKSTSSYGTKVHIHNHKKFTHVFDCLGKVSSSFLINAIKSLFFYNEYTNDKDLEDLFQSVVFARGIETLGQELKECELANHDYVSFISKLKVNLSDDDNFRQKELPHFEFDSILKKQHKPIEKFIEHSQVILKQRCPWIIVGGEKAEKVVRCAFAVVMRHEKLFEYFIEVGSKIIQLEETKGSSKLTLNELMSIEKFESLLFVWTEVNKIRQWYMEHMKSLSDEKFEIEMREILGKCEFMFNFQIPKGIKKIEKSSNKVDHLEIFGGYQLNQIGIENNLVTKNVIKYMKISGKLDDSIPENQEKKTIRTVLNCIKLENLSLDSIKNAINHLNIKAKFRALAIGLINSILSEAKSTDIKLIITKQVIQALRMTSGKRLVPVEDDIKKASPTILQSISRQFHELIRHIFNGLMASNSSFYISSFCDCLFWNFKPRDLRMLISIGAFENIFIRSPNECLFQAWKLLPTAPSHRSNYTKNYSHQLTGHNMLELFDMISTALIGRIITNEDIDNNQISNPAANIISVNPLKKAWSIAYDKSFEKFISHVFSIINSRLEHYLTLYENFFDNVSDYQENFLSKEHSQDQFTKVYFDEDFLTTFLLFIHKFTVNQSSAILPFLINPEMLSSLFILLRLSSIKNAFLITNILRSIINFLTNSDVDSLSDCLKNKSLFTLSNAKFNSRGESSSRKVVVLFLLESLYLLRKGIYEKDSITLASEYEQGAHLVSLLRFMYTNGTWRDALDSIFIDFLAQDSMNTFSTILSILNGDFQELHYGSNVIIKPQIDVSRTINEKFRDKVDESIIHRCGYVVGFSRKDTNVSDLKKKTELKAFLLEEIHTTRREEDIYAIVLIIEKDTYSKVKIKNNEIDFQTVEIKNILLSKENEITICNQRLIDILLEKFNNMINRVDNPANLHEYFITLQLCKVISCLLSPESEISKSGKVEIISRIPMKLLYQRLSTLNENAYTCNMFDQNQFMSLLKYYSETKQFLGFTFQDTREAQVKPSCAKCSVLSSINSILIFQKSAFTGKTLEILACNIPRESNSFKELSKLKVLKFPTGENTSSLLEKLKNCMLLCDIEKGAIFQTIPTMTPSQGIVLLLSNKDITAASSYASHLPYIVVNSDYSSLDQLLTNLTDEHAPTGKPVDKRTLKRISEIRIEHRDNDEEIDYHPSRNENYTEGMQHLLSQFSKKISNVTQDMIQKVICRLINHYMRSICISFINQNSRMVDAESYQFLSKQFKILFFDYCQESYLTVFNYEKFVYLFDVLTKLVDLEKVFNPEDRIIQLDRNENIFSSLNVTLSEIDICNNTQIDLLDLFIENQLTQNVNKLTSEIYLNIVIQVEYFAVLTVNSDLYIFLHFLKKLYDLIQRLFSSLTKDTKEAELDRVILTMKKKGLDKLFRYLGKCVEKEGMGLTIRTKKMVNFLFDLCKDYYELNKRLFNFTEMLPIDDLNCTRLSHIFFSINLLYLKTQYPELRYQALLNTPSLKDKMTSQCLIPLCNDIFEYTLDFTNAQKITLTSKCPVSQGRILLTSQVQGDANSKYCITGMSDDTSSSGLTVYPRDKILVAKSESLKYHLSLSGYSEPNRTCSSSLSHAHSELIKKLDFDHPDTIKKVVNHPAGIVVLTSDGNVHVKGYHNSFGGESDFPNLSSENKWNEIAQKEGLIDLTTNSNSAGMLMVTPRSVWVTGCNSSCIFSSQFPDYCSFSSIKKWDVPFNCSKVVEISLGYSHSIFRLDDSSLYGCGSNDYTQLLLPVATSITSLQRLPVHEMKCMMVSCGHEASLFIMEEKDGSHRLYSAGYNGYGHIGQGYASDNHLSKCLGVENVEFRYATMSGNCCCAISKDGKLYTWGCGSSHNLAQQTSEDIYQPILCEFYSNKRVMDAVITSVYLAVRTVEPDGSVKLWMSGDNTTGVLGIDAANQSYCMIPIEVDHFKDSVVVSMYGHGCPDFISFVSTCTEHLTRKFEYACSLCNKTHNRHVILNKGKKLCLSCFKSKANIKIAFGLKGIGITTVDTILSSLPDLTELNSHVKKAHRMRCNGCNEIIPGIVFMSSDTLGIGSRLMCFCEACYFASGYFDIPRLVVCVKGKIQLSKLPQVINSSSLLGFNTSNTLLFSKYIHPNEDGKRIIFSKSTDEMIRFNKLYNDIRPEHLLEYHKVTESEGEKSYEELVKLHHLSRMSKEQIEIIKDTVTKLSYSLNELRPYVLIEEENSVKDIYLSNLPFLNKKIRLELFEKILYEDAADIDPDGITLVLSRGKCAKFKQKVQVDAQGKFTFFGQSFHQLKNAPLHQFLGKQNNRLFKAELVGEGATDAGGPYREVMNLMCEELQSPYLELLIPTPNNRGSYGQDREKWTINPSAQTFLNLEMFTLLGKLFGFAARSLGYINLSIPSFIWKQILEQPVDMCDLEKIDMHTANFISDLIELEAKGVEEAQFEYIYDQHFTIALSNGKEVEVKPGGSEMKVTWDNRKEYAKLALETRYSECKRQIDALKRGF